MFVAFAFFLGLLFGSFGTVVAYRVPRRENIATGRSRCPNCDRQIKAIENVPVVSYLLLRGRCPGCGQSISLRYPAIEISTGALFALAAWKFELSVAAFTYMMFFWSLVVLTVIDLEHKLLLNRIIYPALALGVAGLAADAIVEDSWDSFKWGIIGAAALGGIFFLIFMLAALRYGDKGFGFGDVRLSILLGLFLGHAGGLEVVIVGAFLSFLVGGVISVALLFGGRAKKGTSIPFGPSMAMGAVLALIFGEAIADWYLGKL